MTIADDVAFRVLASTRSSQEQRKARGKKESEMQEQTKEKRLPQGVMERAETKQRENKAEKEEQGSTAENYALSVLLHCDPGQM